MTQAQLMVEGLAELLRAADRRTLAAVVTHLSGDPTVIRDLRDRPAIEATAAQVLPPFMLGMASPAAPDDELLQAAMDLAVGAPIPPEYRDYAREQTGIGPVPPLAPIRAPEDFRVLVIGAGASGIMVARTLDNRGLTNFRIAEANASPGGAWWKNTYPGCRVDTPSLLYSYSFDQDPGWPEHFSPQPALLQYLRGVVDDSGLTDRLDVDTRVTSLRWNENEAVWHVEAAHSDGSRSNSTANVVVAAPGLLSVPKLPDIPGRESFAGPAFHSAEWDHSVDLAGKRVAVIGTGASAQQIVPAIAPIAGEVVVYQRSPQWLMPHEKYGRKLTGLERDLYDRIPMYREWNRFAESWRFGDGTTPLVTVDPEWDDPRSISAANDRLRDELEKYIRREVGTRPDLLEKVMPSYPPFTKRMLIDNGWYQALLRDNVRLNTAAVTEMTPDGVRTTDGFDEVDVVVFATGFHADRFLSPMQVTGVGGVDVTAELDRDPQAYLGLALPDCPNFFLTPGPNAYLGHAGNGMFFAECHARYISECLRLMLESGSREIVVRPEAVRRYALETRSRLDSSVWNNPEVDSWFKGERKHIVTVAAGSVLDFWNSYRRVDVSAYDFAPRG